MIKVMFSWNKPFHFEIKGHAESGPYGHDLVCAAATGITSGMLNVLDERYQDNVQIKVGENDITIDIENPTNAMEQDLKTLLIQLKTLEIQYPKNLKIKEEN